MLIAARQTMGVRSGSDAMVPVAYLESDGNQWIDTRVYATSKTTIEIDVQRVSTAAADQVPIGARLNIPYQGNSHDISIFTNPGSGKGLAAHYAKNTSPGGPGVEDTKWVYTGDILSTFNTVLLSPAAFSVNGSVLYNWVYANSRPTFTAPLTLSIFAMHEDANTKVERMFVGRVAKCKIWLDSALVRDYRPVKAKELGVWTGYMHDRISGENFGNRGTGAFVIGPEVAGGGKSKCVRRSHRRSTRPSSRFYARLTPHLWKEVA